jgi:hypothetical protein
MSQANFKKVENILLNDTKLREYTDILSSHVYYFLAFLLFELAATAVSATLGSAAMTSGLRLPLVAVPLVLAAGTAAAAVAAVAAAADLRPGLVSVDVLRS